MRKKFIEPELLWALYWGNKYSTIKIADIFKYSQCAILSAMDRYNIPRRSISEAKKGNVYENSYKFLKGYTPWNKGLKCSEKTKKKISISKQKNSPKYWLNKSRSLSTKDKISKNRKGKCTGIDNPNWNGGVTPKDKLIRNSPEFNEWRKLVYKRDNYHCQICHDYSRREHKIKLNAHHIKSFAKYPEYRLTVDNGITLCRDCHMWVHHLNPLDFQ